MQLFRLDNDPQLAAQYHADFHVNKLLLEATQILNQALREQGHEDYAFYGSTHSGHTCIEWVKESDGNFAWVLQLIYHLQQEKQHRWQSGPHTSFEKIQRHWFDGQECVLPLQLNEPQTPQPLAAEDYTPPSSEPVEKYRDYYRDVKQHKDGFGYENGRYAPDWLRKA